MIGALTGTLALKKPTKVILDVNGIGFEINISLASFEKLPNEKETVTLYTHLAVREDSMTLFGFSSQLEKEMFELLITVNGIGPKLALNIISGIQIEELKVSIQTQNVARLVSVPGVGRKTAERILLDLRDKVEKLDGASGAFAVSSVRNDAVAALLTLGYSRPAAEKAVRDVIKDNSAIEDVIKDALAELKK